MVEPSRSAYDAHSVTTPHPRVWETLFPTVGDLYSIAMTVLFLLFGVVGLLVTVKSRSGWGFYLFAAACFAAACFALWSLVFPARRVEIDASGTATFMRRNRKLIVQPGQLISINKMTGDWYGLSPFRVVATSGSISFSSPQGVDETLWAELEKWNPDATVSSR